MITFVVVALTASLATPNLPAPDAAPHIIYRVKQLATQLNAKGLADYTRVLNDPRIQIYPELKREGVGWKKHIEEHLLGEESLRDGLVSLIENEDVLREAKNRCGVPPEVIVAINREETNFGKMKERYMALSVFYKKLIDLKASKWQVRWAMLNFVATIKLCKHAGLEDCFSIKSSHEGAIGPNQILPANLETDGVSYANNGFADPRKVEDAYLTTCTFLKRVGWDKDPVRAVTCYLGCTRKNLEHVRKSIYNYVGAVFLYAAALNRNSRGEPIILASLKTEIPKLKWVAKPKAPPKKRKTPRRTAARAFFIDPAKKNRTINHTELNRKIVLADFSAGHNHLFRHDEYRTSFRISRQKHSPTFQSFNHLWFEVCNNHHFLID